MNPIEIKAYTCAKCGRGYTDKLTADKCCETKYCEDCGKELEYKWYRNVCSSCLDKRDYDKATKIPYDEYMKLHKDDYYCLANGTDYFYSDIEELFDSLDEDEFDEIRYCYGIYKDYMALDYESIIEEFENEVNIEDWEVDDEGREELRIFLEQWNKKYGTDRYSVDDKVIVLIDDKLKEEYRC